MARTGLRMMPTFPSSSLKFRTAGFPQYGFKAGVSGGAFPFPANQMIAVSGLPPPFVLLALHILCPALCRGIWRVETPPFEWLRPLYPRGPRSGPGYSVPVHPHLIDPIRPTGGHIGTSPPCGLYPLPSLCARPRRLGDPPLVPCFRRPSFIGMSSSGTTGSSSIACTQFLHRRRWPSTRVYGLGTSNIPHPPILVGRGFSRLYYGSLFATTCRFARPPVGADQALTQSTRTFTSGLPTDWSPAPPPDISTGATGQVPPAGLSPARTPTSIAAKPPSVPETRIVKHSIALFGQVNPCAAAPGGGF
jgi:hypothetical protein